MFGVSAGDAAVARAADEQNGKIARGGGFFAGDIVGIKSAEIFYGIQCRDCRRAEESFSEPGSDFESRIVIGDLAQICERIFGGDCFNARLDCGG